MMVMSGKTLGRGKLLTGLKTLGTMLTMLTGTRPVWREGRLGMSSRTEEGKQNFGKALHETKMTL